MKAENIMLFTAAIRSGKTTAIAQWLNNNSPAKGFLSPDIEGFRKIINLDTGEVIDFQLAEGSSEDEVKIGRFIFAKTTFGKAQQILLDLCKEDLDNIPIIIDEIGKLELSGQGFEPAFSQFLASPLPSNSPILIVVRDSLLAEVIEKYHLQAAYVYHFKGEITFNEKLQ